MVVQATREAATIVVVEDDLAVAQTLLDALDSSGYRVSHAANGHEAKALLAHSRPDLILLDLMLPDVDGLVLCSTLKRMGGAPIVICSATPHKRDAVLGLRLGADDFIAKPFDIDELEARLGAVLRRTRRAPATGNVFRVGNLSIDRVQRRVLVGVEPLVLTPTEYRLMATLAGAADEPVSRNDLALKVWGYADASAGRTMDVHVRRVRAKLSAAGRHAPTIVAVRKRGYKLAPWWGD